MNIFAWWQSLVAVRNYFRAFLTLFAVIVPVFHPFSHPSRFLLYHVRARLGLLRNIYIVLYYLHCILCFCNIESVLSAQSEVTMDGSASTNANGSDTSASTNANANANATTVNGDSNPLSTPSGRLELGAPSPASGPPLRGCH